MARAASGIETREQIARQNPVTAGKRVLIGCSMSVLKFSFDKRYQAVETIAGYAIIDLVLVDLAVFQGKDALNRPLDPVELSLSNTLFLELPAIENLNEEYTFCHLSFYFI